MRVCGSGETGMGALFDCVPIIVLATPVPDQAVSGSGLTLAAQLMPARRKILSGRIYIWYKK